MFLFFLVFSSVAPEPEISGSACKAVRLKFSTKLVCHSDFVQVNNLISRYPDDNIHKAFFAV